MADTTTTPQTRALIGQAKRKAGDARRALDAFATAAAAALQSFDTDTTPLCLDDDAYERVHHECGLHEVFQLATDMEARLVALFEEGR